MDVLFAPSNLIITITGTLTIAFLIMGFISSRSCIYWPAILSIIFGILTFAMILMRVNHVFPWDGSVAWLSPTAAVSGAIELTWSGVSI